MFSFPLKEELKGRSPRDLKGGMDGGDQVTSDKSFGKLHLDTLTDGMAKLTTMEKAKIHKEIQGQERDANFLIRGGQE